MKFRWVEVQCEAHRWFKNGDHPLDYASDQPGIAGGDVTIYTGAERRKLGWEGEVVRYYRHPNVKGDFICPFCTCLMHAHGWLDFPPSGQIVCPGDWIVTAPDSGSFRAISNTAILALTYEV